MQDRPPRRKEVPDESLPEPVVLSADRQVRLELKGPFGCALAILLLAIAFAILVAAALAGLIAVAVAF